MPAYEHSSAFVALFDGAFQSSVSRHRQWLTGLSLLLLFGSAFGADLPKRKPGLWSITTTVLDTNGKASTDQVCALPSDDLFGLTLVSGPQFSCEAGTWSMDGSKIITDKKCHLGNVALAQHSVFTGDFSAAYDVETDSIYTPPLYGVGKVSMRITAKRVGDDCPRKQ